MKHNSWSLSHVEIENFKAIGNAALKIEPGFTVITGPNGCGKSCFLESIGFGLGASSAELRVSNLAELSCNDRPGQQVRVILKFTNGKTAVTVGSAVVDRTRLYLVGNAKVTKTKFSQTLTETLGFSNDSISWNISQRAVQDIAKASPKKLFDTLCFVAGTHSVLEARNLANQQIVQSEQQLVAVISVIKKLEEGIESERYVLQLMNEKDEVEVALRDASQGKELGEKVYEVAKKYVSIIAAVTIARELAVQNDEEKELVQRLNDRLNSLNDMNDDFVSVPHDSAMLTASQRNRKNVDLQKYRTANTTAGDAVSEALSSMSQKNKTVRQLRAESIEQVQVINDTKVRLKEGVLDAAVKGEAHSLMNEVTIPALCMRISALELEMQSVTATSGVGVIIAQKIKQLRNATDVTKHSESLLMAMTARASQEQSKETAFIGKLERLQQSRDDLAVEMKTLVSLREKRGGKEVEASSSTMHESKEALCLSVQDVLLMQLEVQVLHRQIRSLARSLRLPGNAEGDDVSRASREKSNSTDGDLGYLADILHFPCGDDDMSIPGSSTASSSKSGSRSSSSSHDNSRYIIALDVILGSKLCVRVCRDGAAAELIMVAQSKNRGAAQVSRIWPVDLLSTAPTRSKPFLDILKKYGDIAIDPATLVRISRPAVNNLHTQHNERGGLEASSTLECSSMQKVLLKALESWIIVQGDEAASRIIQDRELSRHINGVVTLDGNKHALGSLTVGFGGRRPGGRDNGYPEVRVALQIKYRRLKSALESIEGQLSVFDRKRSEENEHARQSSRMADLGSVLLTSERAVGEMELTLSAQSERAAQAHRELSVVRSKFQEAEAHRDRVRGEMEQLNSSNDEEKIELSRVQAERTLSDLVERRNALEKNASEYAVSQMEVEAEIIKLQDVVSGAQEAFESLTGEIEEKEQELQILSDELTRLEAAARECKQQLNECEQRRVQEEEEETELREEIEAKRESIRQQSGKLTANFKKYGQGVLAEKYRNESRAGEWSEDLISLKVGDPSGKIDERKKGLESSMERERVSVQREVRAMVGDDQLSRLEEDTEMFLKGAREAVVEKRECVSQLVLEAARVKALLSMKMQGLGVKEGKQNSSSALDSTSDDDSSDSEGESRAAARKKKKGKQRAQEKGREKGLRGGEMKQQQLQQQQRSEGKMREAIHRKSSLLNVVKQKYEQILLSIAALAEGTKGVDGATAELHSTTYKALRERCQRYFSDLVPGKRLDLVPVDYNGNLEKGLKFVLVKGRKTDRKDDEEEDEDMSVKSVESRDGDGDGSEGEKEAGDPKGRGDGHGKDSMLAAVRRCFKSTEELSGGQRALLGLSFVFAAALHKTSPLYLLDEVDAALDESNQKTAGAVIAKIFQRSQVVCVSHHSCFQEQATSCIPVFMRDGRSVIGSG